MKYKSFFSVYEEIKSDLIVEGTVKDGCRYSFLIPAYRNPKCLKRALDSIYKQQGCPEYIVVVVDDSGEDIDGMMDVINEYSGNGNLFYYKNVKRLGLFGNWNRCYELAQTTYCCFLNHDDGLSPNYLRRIDEIMSNSDYDSISVGNTIYHGGKITSQNGINKNYLNRPGHIQKPAFNYFLYREGFPPSGTCIKREVVYKLGGYDERYYPAGDYEFDARLIRDFKVGILWERLCNIYTDESTSMKEETIIESAKIDYYLNLHVYNDIFNKKGKYDWIAAIKYWTMISSINGYNNDEMVDKKYSSRFWKGIYRVFVNFMRLTEMAE